MNPPGRAVSRYRATGITRGDVSPYLTVRKYNFIGKAQKKRSEANGTLIKSGKMPAGYVRVAYRGRDSAEARAARS